MKIKTLSFDSISQVTLAILVPAGKGRNVHKNRKAHGFALNMEGTKKYCFDDGTVLEVHAGDIIYLPQGSNYRVETLQIGRCYAINFRVIPETVAAPFVFNSGHRASYAEDFRIASELWSRDCQANIAEIMSRLYHIIWSMENESLARFNNRKKNELIENAQDFISNRFTDRNLSVELIASYCGVSEVYLRRVLKENRLPSPIEIIRTARMDYAKNLIYSDMYPLCEIAFMSGYGNYSYFSRDFKKINGCSPSEYRDSILAEPAFHGKK